MLLLFHFKVKVTEKVDVMIEIMSKYTFGLDYVANVLKVLVITLIMGKQSESLSKQFCYFFVSPARVIDHDQA